MREFKLPDLGEGMQEAEIRRWLVKPGDTVKQDQPMVELETDKAVVEIPSPFAGRVSDIRVPEGSVAELGQVLVIFDSADGGSATAKAPVQTPAPAATGASASTPGVADPVEAQPVSAPGAASTISVAEATTGAPATMRHRVLAAPAVRKRAFELGIDLAQVPSSQPNGRVTMEDVERYVAAQKEGASTAAPTTATTASTIASIAPTATAPTAPATNGTTQAAQSPQTARASASPVSPAPASPPAPSAEDERKPLTGLRRRIAEHMEQAWRSIPHAVAFDEVDTTELVALRQSLKPAAEQMGVRLTYMPLLIKLLIPALKEHPLLNAHFDEQKREIILKHSYHIGVATDAPEGLIVPVLRDADKLSITRIAQQLEHLVEGAKQRTLSLQEVSGSTFTLNNIGSFGGSTGTPIINAPEVAILAVGRMQEKAIVRNGAVVVRMMMPLTLSFDHRVIDGGTSGRFLESFKALVEHPQRLLLDLV